MHLLQYNCFTSRLPFSPSCFEHSVFLVCRPKSVLVSGSGLRVPPYGLKVMHGYTITKWPARDPDLSLFTPIKHYAACVGGTSSLFTSPCSIPWKNTRFPTKLSQAYFYILGNLFWDRLSDQEALWQTETHIFKKKMKKCFIREGFSIQTHTVQPLQQCQEDSWILPRIESCPAMTQCCYFELSLIKRRSSQSRLVVV